MRPKFKEISPRRITWSVMTIVSFLVMLGFSLVAFGIWGMFQAIQSLPWPR